MTVEVYPEKRTKDGKRVRLKDKWRVVIHCNGTRRDRVFTGKKTDAHRYGARVEEKMLVEEGKREIRNVPTFSDFCVTDYRPYAETEIESTWRRVRQYQVATLMEFLGDTKLDQITTTQVARFKRKHRNRGLKRSSVNDLLKTLSAVLTYAREMGYRCASPKIVYFKITHRDKKPRAEAWTLDEVNELFKKLAEKQPDILPMVVCIANTGMRKGEALNLRWEDVDLEKREITIRPNEEWQPKDGKARKVPISDALVPWLTVVPRRSEKWVFPSAETGRKYVYWPQLKFNKARDAAGIGTGGPHRLRHTYATYLVLESRDLFLASKILGHTHTRVTEIYAGLLSDHLDRARDAISIPATVSPAALKASRKWKVAPENLAHDLAHLAEKRGKGRA